MPAAVPAPFLRVVLVFHLVGLSCVTSFLVFVPMPRVRIVTMDNINNNGDNNNGGPFENYYHTKKKTQKKKKKQPSALFTSKENISMESPPNSSPLPLPLPLQIKNEDEDEDENENEEERKNDKNKENLVAFIPSPTGTAGPAPLEPMVQPDFLDFDLDFDFDLEEGSLPLPLPLEESNSNANTNAAESMMDEDESSARGTDAEDDPQNTSADKLEQDDDPKDSNSPKKDNHNNLNSKLNKKASSPDTPAKSKAKAKAKTNKRSKSQSITSLGSFLLKRKQIEENEIQKIIKSDSIRDDDDVQTEEPKLNPNSKQEAAKMDITETETDEDEAQTPSIADADSGIQRESFDEALQKFASDAETTLSSFIDIYNPNADALEDDDDDTITKKRTGAEDEDEDGGGLDLVGMDLELIKEVDESISILTGSGSAIGRNEILKGIEVLPGSIRGGAGAAATTTTPSVSPPQEQDSAIDKALPLPLSDARHNARIELDMRRLAVTIASGIENEEQWKAFCEDGGGVLPLLECIRDGARDIRQGAMEDGGGGSARWIHVGGIRIRAGTRRVPIQDQGANASVHGLGMEEERDAAFDAACNACKTLRDLSVLSKPFSAIITDAILRADSVWATTTANTKKGDEKLCGGVISDMVVLLKYSAEVDNVYKLGVKSNTVQKVRQRVRKPTSARARTRGVRMNWRQRRGEYCTLS
jgi:hypothetical protein